MAEEVFRVMDWPRGGPLLGNMRAYRADPLAFLRRISQAGKMIRWHYGPFPVYQANDPEVVHEVLVVQAAKFHKTNQIKAVLKDSLGNGLLVSDGDFWRRQRRMVQPAFHARRIGAYADLMVRYTQEMLGGWRDGARVDISREMMALTLRVVAKALFDTDVAEVTDIVAEVATVGQELANRRFRRLFNPPAWLPTRDNRMSRREVALLDGVVLPMIEARLTSGEDRGDLLSMLVLSEDDQGRTMTVRQARDEVATLILAGHETTALTLAWTWMLLALHPEVADRLHGELSRVLGGRPPRADDLPQLPYTEMVVKESMRLYPPAWIVARQAIEDADLGGFVLPKYSTVFISPYSLHRDPRYFEDPDRFDPERFAPGREELIPRSAYLPFGAGPRVCIGNSFAMLEARLVLATMAQHVGLALVGSEPIWPSPLITLRPDRPILMTVGVRLRARLPEAA
jgi:cytochrome P450